MGEPTPSLPTDLDLCHQMIRELTQSLQESQADCQQLRERLDRLLRQLYGKKSEKLDPSQLLLFEENSAQPPADPQGPPDEGPSQRKRRRRDEHGRSKLPDHLERRRIEHDLSDAQKRCPCCQEVRVKIGEQVSEQLDYQPASLFVNQHVRFTYACPNCEGQLERAELPAQPIDKGLAGPGLLAQVIVSKFVDHLPLYRQEQIFSRWQVSLARSTLCDWMAACGELLNPLAELMRLRILQSRMVGCDETPIRVLSKGCQLGRFWVYRGDEANPYVFFEYRPDKSRDGPEAFFADYRGYVQVDGACSFDPALAGEGVVRLGCWAHARRKFYEARENEPLLAHQALGRIGQLYEIERRARSLSESERLGLRQSEALPLLEGFKDWLWGEGQADLPKSSYGQAVGYALGQWEELVRYVEAGYLSIDNNAVERAIRPVALGRKNYLFVGTEGGGETAAVLYSVVSSCRRVGVEPFGYLRDVLSRLATTPSDELAELLPDNWQASREEG